MNIAFYLHDEHDPVVLEKRLCWLKKRYHLISSEEVRAFYYEGRKWRNTCHLTIDDGWLSTYQVVFPLLKKHHIPASIFVSPKMCLENGNFWYMEYQGYDEQNIKEILLRRKFFLSGIDAFPVDLLFKEMKIDDVHDVLEEYRNLYHVARKSRGVVNIQELREMDRSGLVEIGAHTLLHPVLAREDISRSVQEIEESITGLSSILKRKITTFAYPNGLPGMDFGQREMNILKTCGIELAYSVEPGRMLSSNNPLSIPRTCSIPRLQLGRIGLNLPSLHDQVKRRRMIKKYRI